MINETYIKKEDGSLELVKTEVVEGEALSNEAIASSIEEQLLALYAELKVLRGE